MAENNRTGGFLSWRRVFAIAITLGIHVTVFGLLYLPAKAPEVQKRQQQQEMVFEFQEPPPPPPPEPEPPKIITKVEI